VRFDCRPAAGGDHCRLGRCSAIEEGSGLHSTAGPAGDRFTVREYLKILQLAARDSQEAVQDALRGAIARGEAVSSKSVRLADAYLPDRLPGASRKTHDLAVAGRCHPQHPATELFAIRFRREQPGAYNGIQATTTLRP